MVTINCAWSLIAVAAWASASGPVKNGISTWPAFCSVVMAATAAAADIESRGDEIEDFALDTIDDALFGSDDDEAIVITPGGQPMAVFQMIGDGTYGVMEGRDAQAAVCALVVIQVDEAELEPAPADD